MRITRTVAATAALATILTVAVGCSATPSPAPGGDEVIIASGDIDTLDVAQFRSTAAYLATANVYATLLRQDFNTEDDGVLLPTGDYGPYLAETAEWNDAHTQFTVTLKPDLTFADGTPITSADVVYSFQRAFSDVGYSVDLFHWMNIAAPEDIVATDDTTVVFTLTGYTPLLEQFLAFQDFAVLNAAAAKENSSDDDPWAATFFGSHATESGPYVIESRNEGQDITLTKNEAFTADDISQAPGTVTVQNLPDPQQAFLALQNGAVDVFYDMGPDLAQKVADDVTLKLYDLPYSNISYLGMNALDPIFADVRVRQAISMLVPYETLRDKVLHGFGNTAYGAVPYPMSDALDETGGKNAYDTDVDGALALLAEAGVDPASLDLTLTVPASNSIISQSGVFIQSALEEAGITVQLEQLSDSDYNTNLGSYQMFLSYWYSWGEDSIYQMYFLLHTGVFTNYSNYSNPQLDALLDEAMATTDTAERSALSQQAQQLVIDDAPWAFLFTKDLLIGAQSNVSGITLSDDAILRFDKLRLE